jgi:hypothetical protein
MPPTDPRYLAADLNMVLVEYEAWLCSQGEPKKTCPRCGGKSFRKKCPHCKGEEELTGDALYDDIMRQYADGGNPDLDALFNNDQFVPVAPGEQDGD